MEFHNRLFCFNLKFIHHGVDNEINMVYQLHILVWQGIFDSNIQHFFYPTFLHFLNLLVFIELQYNI